MVFPLKLNTCFPGVFLDLSELLTVFSFLMECSSFELEHMHVYVLLIHICTYEFKYKYEQKSHDYWFQEGERTKNDCVMEAAT